MFKKIVLMICCSLTLLINVTDVSAQDLNVVLRFGPPAPRVEYKPHSRIGYTWADGHWEGRGRRHIWIKGYWLRNQRGYAYEQAHWEQSGNQWKMYRGKWQRDSSDRDHDSVGDRDGRSLNRPRRH